MCTEGQGGCHSCGQFYSCAYHGLEEKIGEGNIEGNHRSEWGLRWKRWLDNGKSQNGTGVRIRAKVLWHRVKVGAGTHVVYKFREF